MPTQAIADPEELERFARGLQAFNYQLNDTLRELQGEFAQLGSTWRDQEHVKFAQEFEQTVRVLHNFMRITDEHIPFLMRKAQRLRDYLGQR